jgi:hypothetical protein
VLQVAQATVHQLARAAGGPRGVVGALDQGNAVTARGRIERNAGAGDPAADHHEVELVGGEGRNGISTRDHALSLPEDGALACLGTIGSP